RTFGVKSLMALPLIADEQAIGAAILAERTRNRRFTPEEVQRAQALAVQAAVAIKNARLHALAEEERHLQKDFVLIGFGQWGQKAYQHLLTLKQFFNFRTHVVEQDSPGSRDRLGVKEEEVRAHGDSFYWDSHGSPARDQLERERSEERRVGKEWKSRWTARRRRKKATTEVTARAGDARNRNALCATHA